MVETPTFGGQGVQGHREGADGIDVGVRLSPLVATGLLVAVASGTAVFSAATAPPVAALPPPGWGYIAPGLQAVGWVTLKVERDGTIEGRFVAVLSSSNAGVQGTFQTFTYSLEGGVQSDSVSLVATPIRAHEPWPRGPFDGLVLARQFVYLSGGVPPSTFTEVRAPTFDQSIAEHVPFWRAELRWNLCQRALHRGVPPSSCGMPPSLSSSLLRRLGGP